MIRDMGLELIEKGYSIIPVVAGEKCPLEKGWTTKDYDRVWFDKAVVNGSAECSVGIKSKYTPGVDIDTTIAAVQDLMFDYIWENLQGDFVRWGKRPLVIFRCETPFKKMSSKKFFDSDGEKHQVEILGDGQQYVISGTHPSGIEYSTNGDIVPVSELPLLDAEKARALIDYFETIMTERGVSPVKKEKLPLVLAQWQIEEKMASSGLDVDDYHEWVKMGQALHHQLRGGPEGLVLWHKWSADSDKYKPDVLDSKWESFKSEGGLTFASIIYAGKKAAQSLGDKALEELQACAEAKDISDLLRPYRGQLDGIDLEIVAQRAKNRFKELSNITVPIGHFRSMLKAEADASWADGWFFLMEDNVFYNKHALISTRGFDNMFADKMVGSDVGATTYVCQNSLVEKVHNSMYMPGFEEVFDFNHRRYVNTYQGGEPDMGEYNQEAVDIFIAHCERVVPDDRLRQIFYNFLAHHIRKPGDKIKWAVMLQGQPGDGKTYFEELMRAILGFRNVKPVSNIAISSNFNSWAEGAQLNVLNEIKITGHNRYEIFNNVKPVITDDILQINSKGLREKEIINITNYFIFTNYKDGIPLDGMDRRIFPLFSQAGILSSEYYDRLFDTAQKNYSSISTFLLSVEVHPEFKPKGRAPQNHFKEEIVDQNLSSIEQVINEEKGHNIYICDEYVSVKAIRDAHEREFGEVHPNSITNKLFNTDYFHVGRMRSSGVRHNFWSRKKGMTLEYIRGKIDAKLSKLQAFKA